MNCPAPVDSSKELSSVSINGIEVQCVSPEPPEDAGGPGLTERPELLRAILAALDARVGGDPLAVLLLGPPGSGKTTLARQAARALGLPLYRFQGDDAVTADDLLCTARITHDRGVRYVLTQGAAAALSGGLLLIDDVEKIPAAALSSLIPMFDRTDSHIDVRMAGVRIPVHPRLRLLFAANAIEPLPQFFRSRIVLLRVEHPPVDVVLQMVSRQLPGTEALGPLFKAHWDEGRQPVSPRRAIAAVGLSAKLQASGLSTDDSVKLSLNAIFHDKE